MLSDFPVIEEIVAEYKGHRIKGFSRAEATDKIKDSYRCELADADDAPLVWIGLADAQFACKELSAEAAQCGLKAIESIEGLELAQTIGIKHLAKRKERYSQPEMPERKSIREGKKFRCSWEIGDTFAYRIKGEEAEKYDLAGKYMLLRKVSEVESYNGQVHPVVSMTLWDKPYLPTTAAEFLESPFLRISGEKPIAYVDKFEYRTEILFATKRQVEQLELQFLGNFTNVEMPEDEIVLTAPAIYMTLPKKFDAECCLIYRRDIYFRTHVWIEK